MNNIRKLLQNIDLVLKQSIKGDVNFQVKEEDTFVKGDVIFTQEAMEPSYIHDLSKELDVPALNVINTVNRVDGEFVGKGELIAEAHSNSGMVMLKVYAGEDGIISLNKIDKGIVEILSEYTTKEVKAEVKGRIKTIDKMNEYSFTVSSLLIKPFAMKLKKDFEGTGDLIDSIPDLYILKEGDSVYSVKDINRDVNGKVVYVGKYVYREFVKNLFVHGAKAVITNTMDITDFNSIDENIIVLQGFGHLPYEPLYLNIFKKNVGNKIYFSKYLIDGFSIVDGEYNVQEVETKYVRKLEIGDKVISFELDSFGREGVIVDFEDKNKYSIVEFSIYSSDKKERAVIEIANLEVLSN